MSGGSSESDGPFWSAAIMLSFWSVATASNLNTGTIGLLDGNADVFERGACSGTAVSAAESAVSLAAC